tara:strand:- start:2066 stop:2428 length:363 start_codon:yes stop_codon:yes gene_type:complete
MNMKEVEHGKEIIDALVTGMAKVRNMRGANGNAVPNQFEIFTTNGIRVFQSYNAIVAARISLGGGIGTKVVLFDPYWDNYSGQTNRYLLQFLMEDSIKDVRRKVEDGVYVLASDLTLKED